MLASLKSKVLDEVGKIVIGREEETSLLLTALLARGHVLAGRSSRHVQRRCSQNLLPNALE